VDVEVDDVDPVVEEEDEECLVSTGDVVDVATTEVAVDAADAWAFWTVGVSTTHMVR
jgi:hypothetical protein